MPRTKPENRSRIFDIADSQGGFFTAKQAESAGFSPKNFGFHVKTGNWFHEGHGIYRLRDYPEHPRQDLIRVWLWSRNRADQPQAVFSHETALSLYELTDYIPKKISITVPSQFRKGSVPSPKVQIHKARLEGSSVKKFEFLPMTSPIQTLLDIKEAGRFSAPEMTSMINQAINRGLVIRSEITKNSELREFLE